MRFIRSLVMFLRDVALAFSRTLLRGGAWSYGPQKLHPSPIIAVASNALRIVQRPRARQCLAWAHCAAAENRPTPMGDVSDHATHASLSRQAGIDPKQVADRPRTRCESGRLHCRRPRQTTRRGGGVGVRTGASRFGLIVRKCFVSVGGLHYCHLPNGTGRGRPCFRKGT